MSALREALSCSPVPCRLPAPLCGAPIGVVNAPSTCSLENAESQVCRFYLKGGCAYGSGCRYLHTKPEWASAARRPEAAKGYVARVVPRPAADDLSQQLPISRLRLGGQAPDSGAGGSGGAASQLPLPIPLPLPADPFGEAGAGAQEASDSWQQHHQSQRQQQGQQQQQEQSWDEPPDYWAAAGEGGEQQWGGEEEGWGGEEEGWGEEAYAEGEEEHWEEGEAGEDGSWPADGGEQGQEQQAWGVPPAAAEQQAWAASAPPSLRSLCMSWFRGGSCAAGDGCKLAHGNLCPVGGWVGEQVVRKSCCFGGGCSRLLRSPRRSATPSFSPLASLPAPRRAAALPQARAAPQRRLGRRAAPERVLAAAREAGCARAQRGGGVRHLPGTRPLQGSTCRPQGTVVGRLLS